MTIRVARLEQLNSSQAGRSSDDLSSVVGVPRVLLIESVGYSDLVFGSSSMVLEINTCLGANEMNSCTLSSAY